ncbi:hypothetical protein Hanom_Chr05g00465801 [Helianthus anomalus]
MNKTNPADKDKKGMSKQLKMRVFEIWTKMATKCKPQGPRFKKFEIWTKMTKLTKSQGPKWQFTHKFIILKHYVNPNEVLCSF